jgi:hypothetical protein
LYPGSHFELQNYFQAVGFSDVLSLGIEAMPKIKFSRPPVQICGKAGDVIIVNYLTAHLVAPNISSNIRYCVYFRLKTGAYNQPHLVRRHRPESMLNAWVDWPGLVRAHFLKKEKEKIRKEKSLDQCNTGTAIAQSLLENYHPINQHNNNGDSHRNVLHVVNQFADQIQREEEELRKALEKSKTDF